MLSVREIVEDVQFWVKTRGPWWAASVTLHALAIASLGLIVVATPQANLQDVPKFDEAKIDTEIKDPPPTKFEVGETPIEPSRLDTESLTLTEAPGSTEATDSASDPSEETAGGGRPDGTSNFAGLGGFDVRGLNPGPALRGAGGFGVGKGEGTGPGSGGSGSGFGGRSGRKGIGNGATAASERAVAAALDWIKRHQNPNGSWSIDHQPRCTDPSCTGKGSVPSDVAATALCLLPFFAAGQTHESKGPYKDTIAKGIYWLISKQSADGNLPSMSGEVMYTHGLASICLCEAYGMSNYDRKLREPAQRAIDFIAASQSPTDGGWRYKVKETPGDTSVVGWQVMALKSAQMAGLKVDYKVLEGAEKFLKGVSTGNKGGLFSYLANPKGPTESTSAVGLLCTQYLGADRRDPRLLEGSAFLMQNLPRKDKPHVYYWYYATQVMHNMPGYEWDQWNRAMRKLLIETQAKEGCAAGSWDPNGHNHGKAGGRIMVTTLSCLTLEVYYRYLPLYKLDGGKHNKAPGDDPLKEKPAGAAAAQ